MVALVNSISAAGTNGVVSGNKNTVGATLQVWASGFLDGNEPAYPAGGLFDSKTNVWNPLTIQTNGGGSLAQRLWYAANSTDDAAQNWTTFFAGSFSSFNIGAFSGIDTSSPFRSEATGATGTGLQTIAPSAYSATAGDLLILTLGLASATVSGVTPPAGFTLIESSPRVGGSNVGCYLAWGTAAGGSITPAWTWTTAATATVTLSAFKPAAGGTNTTRFVPFIIG